MNDRVTAEEVVKRLNSLNDDIVSCYTVPGSDAANINVKRGLRNADGTGVLAGITGIGSVQGYTIIDGERFPMPGQLYYRGYNCADIVESHLSSRTYGYEEVAYLLLMGKLPTAERFESFKQMLAEARELPRGFNEDVIFKAPAKNVMNQTARSILALYTYDENPDDLSPLNLMRQSVEIVARMPLIVANSYASMRHYHMGKSLYIHNPKPELSLTENFLRMMRPDKTYTEEEARVLDLMLMIHADHGGGNNSTFTCRTVSSTGSDTYSAIAAAIGSLKGPLHGGANAKVMDMFRCIEDDIHDYSDDDEIKYYLSEILAGNKYDHSGKIYGLGHAVYTISDPRAEMIKKYARTLAETKGRLDELELMEKIETIGKELIMSKRNRDVPICANVDMYSGLVYNMLDIPVEVYTPLFAIARCAGWCAHRIEEVLNGKRIIRPAYRASIHRQEYIPIELR